MPQRPRYEDQVRHMNGYSPSAAIRIEDVPEGLFPPLDNLPPEAPPAPLAAGGSSAGTED